MFAQPGARINRLMGTEEMRVFRTKAAEVEETQRSAVHFVTLAGPGKWARISVPVGHVARLIFNDAGVEVAGSEIHPPLIGKAHVGDIDDRFAKKPLAPPVEKPATVRI